MESSYPLTIIDARSRKSKTRMGAVRRIFDGWPSGRTVRHPGERSDPNDSVGSV
jgi:hypothetical protein